MVNYTALFVCFDIGTRLSTPAGERPVEDLVRGNLMDTLDDGPQPLCWTGRRTLRAPGALDPQRPVLPPVGVLGEGLPRRDLVISPHHRLLLRGPMVAQICGHAEELTIAKSLLPLRGARIMRGRRAVTYHSLLLDRHQIMFAEGALVESFYPGAYALGLLSPRQRAKALGLFPGLIGGTQRWVRAACAAILKRWQGEAQARQYRRETALA